MGLVAENFGDASLARLVGDVSVGHTRYSTAGSSVLANAQPLLKDLRGTPITISHNGNLTNAPELRRELEAQGSLFDTTTDTEVMLHLIARSRKATVDEQIRDALERCEGAFTLVISYGKTIYAIVDSRGFRPMVLGRLQGGVIVASETCALDLVGASMVCELQPGQFLKIEDGHITELPRLRAAPRESVCIRTGVLRQARQQDLR